MKITIRMTGIPDVQQELNNTINKNKIIDSNLRPMPGQGYGHRVNPDGTITLGWNAGIMDNQGHRLYPLPEGIITNLDKYPERVPRSMLG